MLFWEFAFCFLIYLKGHKFHKQRSFEKKKEKGKCIVHFLLCGRKKNNRKTEKTRLLTGKGNMVFKINVRKQIMLKKLHSK